MDVGGAVPRDVQQEKPVNQVNVLAALVLQNVLEKNVVIMDVVVLVALAHLENIATNPQINVYWKCVWNLLMASGKE